MSFMAIINESLIKMGIIIIPTPNFNCFNVRHFFAKIIINNGLLIIIDCGITSMPDYD
jgi:hypothetical protein